jgi:hypothetical protein
MVGSSAGQFASVPDEETLVELGAEMVRGRFESPMDVEWVRRIAASAAGLDRGLIPVSMVVKGKTEIVRETIDRIRREIDDVERVDEIAATLWTLLSMEVEITIWQIGEIHRLAAASERTERSELFHRDVSETLVVALQDSHALQGLSQGTISSTRESLLQIAEIETAVSQSVEAMTSAAGTAAGLHNVISELTGQLNDAAEITLLAAEQMRHAVDTSDSLSVSMVIHIWLWHQL